MTFKEIGISDEVLRSLAELGFESPTPIQEEAIPQLLKEHQDLVGLAQTGTGKTAAFGLPLIEKVDFHQNYPQAVIIAPTRELCIQISKDLQTFSKYIKGAKIATIYGGASIHDQAKQIKKGAQIIAATPGRLIDMIKRRMISLKDVHIAVLDEADEMLNMGFKEDIDAILDGTPEDKEVWLFSATMPKEVRRIASNYMTDPFEITVGTKNSSNENIKHEYYCVNNRDRYYALKRIIDYNVDIYGLIFCRTKRETQDVADKLMRDGYNAEPLHGDLSQMQRDKVMKKFRDRTLQILVATDVAARGIDVDDITHVINYNLPDDIENYTHRSGRTARAGKHGVSLILTTPKETYKIKQIEKQIKKQFSLEQVPTGEDICRTQLFSLVDNIKNTEIKTDQIEEYLPAVTELFEDYTKEQLIARFVSAEFNKFLDYYKRSGDLNANPSDKKGRDRDRDRDNGRRNRKDDGDKQRMFVKMGLNKGLNKGAIVRLMCEYGEIPSSEIGRIDLFNEFSFFDVNPEYADKIISGSQGAQFNGENLIIEKSSGKKGGFSGGGGGRRKSGGRDRQFSGHRKGNSSKGKGGNSYRKGRK